MGVAAGSPRLRRIRRAGLAALLTGCFGLAGCGSIPLLGRAPGTLRAVEADRVADRPDDPDPPGGDDRRHLLAGPLHGRVVAVLTVSSAAARVNLRTTDLPGLLYQISTPADSGLAPWVTGRPGVVGLGLRPTGDDGPDTVDILLNRTVRWRIRLAAGAGEQHLDLARGQASRLDLGAGVGLLRLRLPRPRGTVAVVLTGPVGTARIAAPRGVPVRVRIAGGTASVALPRTTRTGTAAGSVFTTRGWSAGVDRYHVRTGADVGRLIVQN